MKPTTRKTQQQVIADIFEVYYKMGAKRSLQRLADHTKLDFDLLSSWSDTYAWDEKIEARENDLQRTADRVYKLKTANIRNRLVNQIDKLIQGMESSSLGLPFDIRTPNDMRSLAQAYESLVRASVVAQTKGIDLAGGKAPTTWADLLSQSTIDSSVEEE